MIGFVKKHATLFVFFENFESTFLACRKLIILFISGREKYDTFILSSPTLHFILGGVCPFTSTFGGCSPSPLPGSAAYENNVYNFAPTCTAPPPTFEFATPGLCNRSSKILIIHCLGSELDH
jgi:hypothetical protein